SDKSSDETPCSDDTTDKNIAKFEVVAKSKGSTSKPENVTAYKVITQKVQTKTFPAKSPIPIRNFILGLAAAHTWGCIDSRLESRKSAKDNSFTLGSAEEADNVKILQWLPQPENSHDDSHFHVTVVLRMAFDPRKSLDYKVVQVATSLNSDLEIQSFGGSIGSDNPMLVLIDILGMLHLEGRLFESRGCLLLVCRYDIGSREFTIYEMMKGCSVWTVRYLVNTDELLTPLPERWLIRSTVWSIGLGEKGRGFFFGDKHIWKGCKIIPNIKDYQSDL
ncbi:hypothetical protein Tco_0672146, partial [Tanacetum coccineum]